MLKRSNATVRIVHGIDMVEVAEIARLLQDPNSHFLNRCFRDQERQAPQTGEQRAEHYAGVFAAKEAVLKAIGTGFGDGIGFTDVEIIGRASGQPTIVLHGNAEQVANNHGIVHWAVSISHTSLHAIASAIGLVR